MQKKEIVSDKEFSFKKLGKGAFAWEGERIMAVFEPGKAMEADLSERMYRMAAA